MNNDSILDLRFEGRLDVKSNKLFNIISNDLRTEFNNLITDLSMPNIDNIDWWVNGVPSRNTFASPFFHYFCCIHFVYHINKIDILKFNKIIVDTQSLKKIIDSIIFKNETKKKSTVIVNTNIRLMTKQLLKRYFGDVYMLFYNTIKLLIAKSFFKTNSLPNKQLVLIDTFIISGYTDSKRWYGCLWDNLPLEIKNHTYFVYTITHSSVIKLFCIYSKLKKNKENYIVKEVYLHFSDLLIAFNYKKRLKQIKVKKIEVLNHNISALIEESLFDSTNIFGAQGALLMHRFIYRLREKKIKVRLAIDWFEGQILDKAWNLGFHTFYSQTNTIAYRPFESYPLYLCSFPIPIECEAGVVPQVFALQGCKTAESVKEFVQDLKTILIPAYKSGHVWGEKSHVGKKKTNNILVALPISINVSKHIIALIIETSNNFVNKNTVHKFILKPHPTVSNNKIYDFLTKSFPLNVVFTNEKSLSVLLHSAKVLITEASSTCLESIAIGVPVILIKREDGLFQNPIPKGIDEKLFRICSSKVELKDALNYYLLMRKSERNNLIINGHAVRKQYFQPITSDGTNRFMGFYQT